MIMEIKATTLRRFLPDYQITNHPFDLGYWARIAGLPRPMTRDDRDGWDQAAAELREEAEVPA